MDEHHDNTVWVVDDDRAVRFVLATALREAGYDVAEFTAAQDVLDALRDRPPGLIFTDVRMPGLHRHRQHGGRVPRRRVGFPVQAVRSRPCGVAGATGASAARWPRG